MRRARLFRLVLRPTANIDREHRWEGLRERSALKVTVIALVLLAAPAGESFGSRGSDHSPSGLSFTVYHRKRELQGITLHQPILADIDGDGKVEAIVPSNHAALFCWEFTPTTGDSFLVRQEPGWPLLYNDTPTTPSIADMDGDGYLEMVVGDEDGYVYLYDLPAVSTAARPWPTAGHDNARTGWYTSGNPLMGPGEDGQLTAAVGSAPPVLLPTSNPASPPVLIRYRVPAAGHGSARVVDAGGREVWRTSLDPPAPGTYAVIWDARAKNGRVLPQGTYFLCLRIGSWTTTRRVVVLR